MKILEALLDEWRFGRTNLMAIIENMQDDDLDRIMPRKGLNTIRKHLEELLNIQHDYVEAIKTMEMNFSIGNYEGNTSKFDLKKVAEKLDKDLIKSVTECNGDEEIKWPEGNNVNIAGHLAAMISHEAMHLGQIIAFCYAMNMPIPQTIVRNYALSG
jgi:uncharacterized damage-inducible protein DinB